MNAPDDLSGVLPALESRGLSVKNVQAVMCMTEGDGLARGFCELAFAAFFSDHLGIRREEVPRTIPMIMIGGCSGLVSPYAALFVEDPGLKPGEGQGAGFIASIGVTEKIRPAQFGRLQMAETVAAKIRELMNLADIGPEDVHCVQVKAPWLTRAELLRAQESGVTVATLDEGRAGVLARCAGAMGVALAMGELKREDLTDETLGRDYHLFSEAASASAGTEREDVAIMVLGNSRRSGSPCRIGHAVLRDGADLEGVYRALASAGLEATDPLPVTDSNPVEHVFLKSAVEMSSACRGRRHVMNSDYLGPYSWLIAKATVHTLVTSVVGDPMMQVSGGGEHQGMPGGGALAVVVNASRK